MWTWVGCWLTNSWSCHSTRRWQLCEMSSREGGLVVTTYNSGPLKWPLVKSEHRDLNRCVCWCTFLFKRVYHALWQAHHERDDPSRTSPQGTNKAQLTCGFRTSLWFSFPEAHWVVSWLVPSNAAWRDCSDLDSPQRCKFQTLSLRML